MYLETQRILLRDFTMADGDALDEIFSDPVVMEHIAPVYSREKTLRFLKDFCIERVPKGAFAAVLKEDKENNTTGKVIGYVLFKQVGEPERPEEKIFEMGWIFNKDYWRKGYAYEICSRLIRHGLDDMGIDRITAETDDTVKSIGLMEKLGMESEGIHEGMHWYAISRSNSSSNSGNSTNLCA
jgi:RimJ/RimL family protein N-acetyltransferase